jgi:chromosomal replication initiator protein
LAEIIHPYFYVGMARIDRQEIVNKLEEEATLPPSFFWKPEEDDHAIRIISFIAGYFSIPIEDLVGGSRVRPILTARQWSIFFVRELTSMTLNEIGTYYTNSDHATIMHSCKRIKDFISVYDRDKETYDKIKSYLE